MHKSLVEDEENFYHTILKRYGKLVWKEIKNDSINNDDNMIVGDDEEGTYIDYNNNGEIKMMLTEENLTIDSAEEHV